MTSVFQVSLPVLMQASRAEGGTLLPWPNGSLLSGRLMAPEQGSGVLLMLGNYRVRVEVPPNTPLGKVWLQLLQREAPSQFRMLTDKQAAALVANMLYQHKEKPHIQHALQHEKASQHMLKQEWAKLPMEILPYAAEAYDTRLILSDKQHGQPQGFVQKQVGQHGFMLHGRLDLPHLGGLVFVLQSLGDVWKLGVHLQGQSQKLAIEAPFLAWLQGKQSHTKFDLQGAVFSSIPEQLFV